MKLSTETVNVTELVTFPLALPNLVKSLLHHEIWY
jgi:hypothetical protein